MRNIYFLIIGFTAIWCVSASDCDVSRALACISTASRRAGSLTEPTCDAWHNCLSQYKCAEEGGGSPYTCNAIGSCSLESWDAVHSCSTMARNCSDLITCYSPCAQLGDAVYKQYCKRTVTNHCYASASMGSSFCVQTKGSQKPCGWVGLTQCSLMGGSNCELQFSYRLKLPDQCRQFTNSGEKASSVLSWYPLTLGVLIATVAHAM